MAANIKNLIRLHEWTVDEKRRKLGELLRLQGELEDQVKQLEEDLVREQHAAASDPTLAGLTYGAYAKKVIQRRENLQESIDQMEMVIGHAQDELSEAYRELKKYEIVDRNRQRRHEQQQDRREQIMLDEIAINQHRRKKAKVG
ncbi:MAG: flagellar FliJ family protein [Magnetovibrio sp.]|nr:flagellar FliJ family protein [Magnetovibrio sp.]